MKKIILTALFLCFIAGTGYSQLKFGFRGGFNWYYVRADDILLENNTLRLTIPSKANLGYHFGVVSQISLFNILIQPELLFTSNKNDVLLKDEQTSQTEGFAEQRIYRMDLPVMLGFKIKSFKVGAGPVGTAIIGTKTNLVDISNYEQKFKTLSFGYQLGVGLDFPNISLDLKYEGKLSKFGDKLTFMNRTFDFDQRSSQLIFGIGLFF
ncbi:MAG TPA: outer membrane beta-barrel protein [Bacteroidales bacterium]|nr:outer membrane beta-barrel protein [Bacteroidales bacterium]